MNLETIRKDKIIYNLKKINGRGKTINVSNYDPLSVFIRYAYEGKWCK